jgi:orotidine-5'-phosphate decarboxylase
MATNTEGKSFSNRFFERSLTHSPLCVGIDPSPNTLHRWGLPDDIQGLREFADRMVSVAAPRVAVVKPQSAFFERHGPEGLQELSRTIKLAKQFGALVIIDCKRGDIGSSAAAYGEAFLGEGSPFQGDAITAAPYCGFGSLVPILDRAARYQNAVFILLRSSNPEGSQLQLAKLPDGRSVVESLADDLTIYNRRSCDSHEIGVACAVLGATQGPELIHLASRMPNSLFLVPGIGAQGAQLADVRRDFGMHYRRVIPNISRAIASAGPKREDLVARVEELSRLARHS